VLAFAVDYLLIAAYLVVLVAIGVVVPRVAPSLARELFGNPLAGELGGFISITLPVTLYFALSESSARQATWGKRKLGLRVERLDGARPSLRLAARPAASMNSGAPPAVGPGRSLGRTALKFVPWELAHACIWHITFAAGPPSPLILAGFALVWVLVGANLASLLISRKHQTLYDWVSGTVVVVGSGE
jgi:uncharacterized RDD family membrane protein YckC